jgi:hypothetical protein
MGWVNIIGLIGSFLLLIKIGIHIYIKLKVDKKFYVGASGHFLNPTLFLPIFDDVVGYPRALKKVGNLFYLISIVSILVFLIGTNIH